MLQLTAPPDLEGASTREAERQDMTPQRLALELLRERLGASTTAAPGESMADALKEFIGCLNSGEITPGGAAMSEESGRKLAQRMVEKRRQGRL